MTDARVSERKQRLAAWLREGLIKLGPTFIKIGQQFSTRVDVLSPEFIKELEMLQDNVPAFSSKAAVATVERALQPAHHRGLPGVSPPQPCLLRMLEAAMWVCMLPLPEHGISIAGRTVCAISEVYPIFCGFLTLKWIKLVSQQQHGWHAAASASWYTGG